MSYIPNTPSLDYVVASTGKTLEGVTAKIYNIFGYRNQWNSNTALGDVAAYLTGGQDLVNIHAVGTTYYINSTSVQDLTAGTGVDRLRIVYLDSAGLQQVITASLNGTTAVSIGAGFTYIQWMESYHSVTEERVAAGSVTISSINGVATEATTMEMIQIGFNRSESMRYKIPAGSTGYLLGFNVDANGTGATARLRAKIFNDDGTASNAHHFLAVATLKDGSSHEEDLHYRRLPAGVVVKLSAIPTQITLGNKITGSAHIMVVT